MRLIREAVNGNIVAIREIYDRTEGKAPKELVFDEDKMTIKVEFEEPIVRRLAQSASSDPAATGAATSTVRLDDDAIIDG